MIFCDDASERASELFLVRCLRLVRDSTQDFALVQKKFPGKPSFLDCFSWLSDVWNDVLSLGGNRIAQTRTLQQIRGVFSRGSMKREVLEGGSAYFESRCYS